MNETIRSRKFKDISFDISKNIVTGDIKVLTNAEAIKNSVKNLIRTEIGERLTNKYIGSNIHNKLFELDALFSALEIKENIAEVIKSFEKRVVLKNVGVKVLNHEVTITISFIIVGEPKLETLEFILLRES